MKSASISHSVSVQGNFSEGGLKNVSPCVSAYSCGSRKRGQRVNTVNKPGANLSLKKARDAVLHEKNCEENVCHEPNNLDCHDLSSHSEANTVVLNNVNSQSIPKYTPLFPVSKLLHWNVGGLAAKLFCHDFIDYVSLFDVICFVETFMADVQTNLFSDHTMYVKPATKLSIQGRKSGGIVCLFRNELVPFVKQIDCKCINHLLFIIDKEVFGSLRDVLFVSVYIHPENSPYYTVFDEDDGIYCLEECLIDVILNLGEVDILLYGDLNARTSNCIPDAYDLETIFQFSNNTYENNVSRRSQDTVINNYGKKLLSMCSTLGLCMFNGICTGDEQGCLTFVSQTGTSVNDYFIASKTLFDFIINKSTLMVSSRIESDHLPLEFCIQSDSSHVTTENQTKTSEVIVKFKWNADLANDFKSKMASAEVNQVIQHAESLLDIDINLALDTFTSCIKQQAQDMKHIIKIKRKGCKNDWFDNDCWLMRKNVRKLLRIFRKSFNKTDRLEYCKQRSEYKKLLHRKKKEHNDSLFERLLSSLGDQQTFWQTLTGIRHKRSQPKHNITIQDWYTHFKLLLDKDNSDSNKDLEECLEQDVELDKDITKQEIMYALKNIKLGKAAGPDEIIGEFFKYSSEYVVDFLVKLFNKLFDQGMYPEQWKESIIMPLFKKGDINDTNNYRGISLCNIASKLYSTVINMRLQKWIESHNITGEHQAGFKAHYSTVDHIFTLLSCIQKQFSHNRKLYVAFVDFEKAFDSISRKLLWTILSKNGVKGKLFRCIKSMYQEVKLKVRDGGKFTDYINCTRGVKQGDVCSPILFSLFINEVAIEIIEKGRHGCNISFDLIELFILLFADDLVLMAETVIGLQTQLNNLYCAATRLELKVNLGKTDVVVFRKGGYLAARERWFFGGDLIKVVNAYKYLGIYFSTKLSFSYACQDLMARAKKATLSILQTMYRFENSSIDVFCRLFDAQVQPILQYGAEIWGMEKGVEIEKIHIFAMKRFLKVNRYTPNDIIYGELGRYPIYINSYIACIRYWLKILIMDENRLPFKCYKMLYNLDSGGKTNWVTNIKNCLSRYGFRIVWENQGVGCCKSFLKMFKQRLIDCRWQEWNEHIQNSDRFMVYRTFKSINTIEPYLYIDANRYVKNALTRFRCGVSPILLHCARYKNTAETNLVCRMCKVDLENELHLVLCCPCLNDLRKEFIPQKYYRYPCNFRLALLLATQNKHILKNLALFLYFTFKRLKSVQQ